MEEVIKPGSVTKRLGHLLIRKNSLVRCWVSRSILSIDRKLPSHKDINGILKYTYVNKYKFHRVSSNGHIYYMDGHGQVWETDIDVHTKVIFNPVCVEIKGNEGTRTVMFRKLTKLECLFL